MEHTGNSPRECEACKPAFAEADRLLAYKPRKVYGRVTTNSRKGHASNQRAARELSKRAWKAHFSS